MRSQMTAEAYRRPQLAHDKQAGIVSVSPTSGWGGEAAGYPGLYRVSVLLFVSCIALGGATTAGYISDVVLQLISIPALLIFLWYYFDKCDADGDVVSTTVLNVTFSSAIYVVMVTSAGIVIAAQYLPVFGWLGQSGVWTSIGANGDSWSTAAHSYSSSIDPVASHAAVMAVLPTVCMFLLVRILDTSQRIKLVGWVVAAGMVSLAIGILQVMQGQDSPLRFYSISNKLEAVGFFANRNHFAALLYVTIIFCVGWFAIRGHRLFAARVVTSNSVVWLSKLLTLLMLAVAGVALARSRAGILLTIAAFAGIIAMSPALLLSLTGGAPGGNRGRRLIFILVALLLVGIGQLGGDRFLRRFQEGATDTTRAMLRDVTLKAATEALPAGTGLATFPSVYAAYEEGSTLRPSFVNRAHNDWIEFLLETGLSGGALVLSFLMWFVGRVIVIWFQAPIKERYTTIILQQCASLAVLLLMVHSVVDYPGRTAAMAACFAVCCGLMLPTRRKRAVV